MSKANELIKAGGVRRGEPKEGSNGGGTLEPTPFVKWPAQGTAHVIGKITGMWTGNYGENATIEVLDASDGLEGEAKGVRAPVTLGQAVNVGLNSATLKDTVSEADVGKAVAFVFDGWKEPAKPGGNRYRLFSVVQLTADALSKYLDTNSGSATKAPVAEPEGFDDGEKLPF